MAQYLRPDITTLWAEDGAKTAPPSAKVAQGWTSEIPPFQHENYIQNRQDYALAYLLQAGIAQWSNTTDYYIDASFVQYEGKIYTCIQTNTGKVPDASPNHWKRLGVDLTDFHNVAFSGDYRDLNHRPSLGSVAPEDVVTGIADNIPSRIPTVEWVINNSIPVGFIGMWSGAANNIPAGWYLCDGTNGTPNLVDKFVVGAGNRYGVGSTGGSRDAVVVAHDHGGLTGDNDKNHTHSGTTNSGGNHSHTGTTNGAGSHSHSGTTNSAGAHTHTQGAIYQGGNQGRDNDSPFSDRLNRGNTGSAGAHTHTFTTSSAGDHTHSFSTGSAGVHTHTFSTGNQSTNHKHPIPQTGESGVGKNMPPYYALCYIMKAPV